MINYTIENNDCIIRLALTVSTLPYVKQVSVNSSLLTIELDDELDAHLLEVHCMYVRCTSQVVKSERQVIREYITNSWLDVAQL